MGVRGGGYQWLVCSVLHLAILPALEARVAHGVITDDHLAATSHLARKAAEERQQSPVLRVFRLRAVAHGFDLEEGGGRQIEGEDWRFDRASHRVIVQAQRRVALPVNLPEACVRHLEHLSAHVAHLAKEPEHVVRLAELVALPDQQTHLALKVHERLEARDPLRKLKLREGQQEAVITAGACDASGR